MTSPSAAVTRSNAPRDRSWYRWPRIAVAAGVLALLAARFGSQPFIDAFRAVDPLTLAAAVGVTAVTTVSCAYRWCAVATGLGVPVRFGRAVPAYFRSQLLNSTLPGGVLGDVGRGLRQYGEGQPRGRALRAVVWERSLGQAVQVLLAVTVLVLVPSMLRARVWPDGLAAEPMSTGGLVLRVAIPVVLLLALVSAILVTLHRRARRPRPGHDVRAFDLSEHDVSEPDLSAPDVPEPHHPGTGRRNRGIVADWRGIRRVRRGLAVIALTSAVAVGGHVTVFLLAAHSVNPDLPLTTLVPSALLVLVVGALPVNLAGWGPREGAAAWVFGLAGLGGSQGLAVSVLYGMLALLGTLPGLVVLLARRRRAADA